MKNRPGSPLAVLLLSLTLLACGVPISPSGDAASPRPLWSFSTPGGLAGSPSVADLDGDGALETVVSADSLGLVVLDSNGSMKWTFSLPSRVVTAPLVTDINADGKPELVAGTDGGSLFALAPDRSLLWTYPADGAIASGAAAADLDGDGRTEVIFATAAGTVVAVWPDGREAWKFRCSGELRAGPAAADFTGDGIPEVVVADGAGRLYLLGRDGSPLWNVSAGSPLLADPAVFDLDLDGRPEIVTGAADGNVAAFRANGTRAWTFQAGGAVNSSIAVAGPGPDGRPAVLFGCGDGRLYCLSPSGVPRWTYYCGAPAGPPAPFNVGNRRRVAFPAGDGKLRLLDGEGVLLMSYNASAMPQSSCAVANLRAGDMPVLVQNGNDRAVRCLPMDEHPTLEWRTRQHDARRTGALPASPDGRLPGSLEWRAPLAGTPDGPPALADTDGDGRAEVAQATASGMLYLLDGESGAVRWRVDVPGPAMRPSAPLVCDLDGDSAPEVAWAGPDGVLRSLRPSKGFELWRADLGIFEAAPSAGDLDGDGSAEIAIGTDSDLFVGVNGTSGATEWALNLSDGVRAPASLADLGGGPALESVVSTAGGVLALRNGTVLWAAPGAIFLPTSPVLADLDGDGTPDAAVGTGRGELRAFSGTDGHQLWAVSVGAALTEPPAALELAGLSVKGLVAALSDGSLVGLSGRDGSLLWKVQADATSSPSAADLDLDGACEIVVGTGTGVGAFSSGGERLWHFPVPGGAISSPAIADTDLDGSLEVAFGGRDGNLYTLSAGGRCAIGSSPWPQYRHDPRRTGNADADAGRFLPDLVVLPASIRPSVAFPDEGGTIRMDVFVHNIGAAASPAFLVSLTDNGTPVGPPREASPVEAGESRVASFPWNPTGGDHELGAEVDAPGTVAESRKDNNAATRRVRVNFRPVAVLGGDLRVDLGEVVLFDGSGSWDPDGESLDYLWSFGDGGTARGSAPIHRYQAFGRFNVTLEVTDGNGATGSGSLNVTVNGPPRIVDRIPDSDVSMAENETSDFSVTASDPEGDPFSVLWRLDGGWAGAGPRFRYFPNFSSEGSHVLTAEVSDGSRTVGTGWNITVRDSPSPILSHRPAWRNLSASTGETVRFGIELRDGQFAIRWFLDGQPVDGAGGPGLDLLTNPSSTGRHSVAVVVNASGHEDRREWLLEVLPYNAPPSFYKIEPPGDGVLMLAYGSQDFLVAVGDLEGGELSVQWYLGGAALLNQTGLQYTYQDRGGRTRLNVTVVASDGTSSAVHTWMVRVNSPPVALFRAVPRTADAGSAVAFDASASLDPDGNITQYRWSFGDGSSHASNGTAASHSYSRPGVYVVELWVTDELGATESSTMSLAVRLHSDEVRSPGSGGLLALAAAGVAAALGGFLHRRDRGPNQRN